ncbi:MAG: BlaI/MecI/CopY family transcriptional regulator [Bacteroides xylanisolvens]
MKQMKRLTVKEEEIMRIFWEHGPMFVRELLSFYDEPKPHYNTVSTLVRGLEEKGFVGYKAYRNTYQYYALVSKRSIRVRHSKKCFQYYNNSYINVVSSFIEEEGMSVDELKSLIEYIEQSKRRSNLSLVYRTDTIFILWTTIFNLKTQWELFYSIC